MAETGSNIEMAYKISEGGKGTPRHGTWFYDLLEIVEALVLATVAVATAWSGYQSALWSSLRSVQYGESSKLRVAAEADTALAADQRLHDALTFNEWIRARSSGNLKLARLFEDRFRDEFRVAYDAWMKLDPLNRPGGPPSPTFMPEYKNKLAAQAASKNGQASAMFDKGTRAQHRADGYVRITVYLATVLLLTALGQRFRFRVVRFCILIIAIGLLAFAVHLIFTLPNA